VLTAGFLLGGPLFIYKTFMRTIPLLLENKLLGEFRVLSPLRYGWYMFTDNEWLFYIIIIIVSILTLKANFKRIWIPVGYISLLALVFFGPSALHLLALRNLSWISSLIIGELSYKLIAFLTERIDKAIALLAVIILLFLPLHILFQHQIKKTYKPELIRVDNQRLETYIFLKNYLAEKSYYNVTVYTITQISSWVPFYITDWSRNISVFKLQPFSSLKYLSPLDPYRVQCKKVLTHILNSESPEKEKISFLLIESPIMNQWYESDVEQLSNKLFSIYGSSDYEEGIIFKVETGDYKALIYQIITE
jgi:uncharacterized membrane protein